MLSTLLTEFPSFISAISMVTDDPQEVIRALIRAEHPSPAFYDAARDLFIKILEKKFSVDQALSYARHIKDPVSQQCAMQILERSRNFILGQPAGTTVCVPAMEIELPNEKKLKVSPVWLRDCHPCQLMLLHFWRKPLSEIQTKAIAGVLLRAIESSYRKYIGFELDFISVAVPDHASGRRLQVLGWDAIQPLRDAELDQFLRRLCDLWDAYHRRGPRPLRGKPLISPGKGGQDTLPL